MNTGPIVTGQQIGLLGGPLYTPYKVLSAVHLSQKEGREAVYWLETNDADFQEISAIDYIDRKGELQQLRWQKDTGGLSCGNIVVDRSLIDLLDVFFDSLLPTEFTDVLRSMVMDVYQEGIDLGAAALALAKRLYPFDWLRFFDPREEKFTQFCRQFLMPLFEETPSGSQCPGFIRDGGVRRPVFRTRTGFALRDGSRLNLAGYPLLPNVHTRPLCQDAYFSSSAAIVGPGEMVYLAPLKALYRRFNIIQPRLLARMSTTLIEPWTRRQLDKLGMDAETLLKNGFDLARKQVSDKYDGPDLKLIESESQKHSQLFVDGLVHLHPAFASIRTVLRKEIKQIYGRIRKESREQSGGDLDRLRKIWHRLMPYEKPQERVMNLFYYMNLYGGTKMIDHLLDNAEQPNTFLEVS